MPATPRKVNAAIGTGETDLYDFPASAVNQASLVSLDLCNTTTAAITVDLYTDNGTTERRFADDLRVPPKTTIQWRGMITLESASDFIRGIASATGVDVTGTVIEYS